MTRFLNPSLNTFISSARLWIGALSCVATLLAPARSFAQATTPPPPTLDDQLRLQLGLGNAAGCGVLLGLGANANGQDVSDRLQALGNQIGNELRAICGPSAVTSASSLGGGLDTLQATKTATQFKLARRRIDQRLTPKPAPAPTPGRSITMWGPATSTWSPATSTWGPASAGPSRVNPAAAGFHDLNLQFDEASSSGSAGLFGEFALEQRTRTATAYEAPYDSDTKRFTVGVDYLGGPALVGAWFSAGKEDATFTRFSPLVAGSNSDRLGTVLSAPGALSSVCGGLTAGGVFDATAKTFGGFVGGAVGSSGFADVAVSMTRRANSYARSVCLIEASPDNDFKLTNGVLSSGSGVVDDIFAGTLSGTHDVTELNGSIRLGGNFGTDTAWVGPRASFTLARTTTAAFAETGKSTVANVVTPVFGNPVTRTLGGPIGAELAFDEQQYTSALLEAGAEVAGRAGSVVPFASGYFRHEFLDGFRSVTARFVQDKRTTPTTFDFGHDAPDANSLLIGGGVAFAAGPQGVVRVEVTKLVADRLYSAFVFSVQARVGF